MVVSKAKTEGLVIEGKIVPDIGAIASDTQSNISKVIAAVSDAEHRVEDKIHDVGHNIDRALHENKVVIKAMLQVGVAAHVLSSNINKSVIYPLAEKVDKAKDVIFNSMSKAGTNLKASSNYYTEPVKNSAIVRAASDTLALPKANLKAATYHHTSDAKRFLNKALKIKKTAFVFGAVGLMKFVGKGLSHLMHIPASLHHRDKTKQERLETPTGELLSKNSKFRKAVGSFDLTTLAVGSPIAGALLPPDVAVIVIAALVVPLSMFVAAPDLLEKGGENLASAGTRLVRDHKAGDAKIVHKLKSVSSNMGSGIVDSRDSMITNKSAAMSKFMDKHVRARGLKILGKLADIIMSKELIGMESNHTDRLREAHRNIAPTAEDFKLKIKPKQNISHIAIVSQSLGLANYLAR